MLLESVNNQQDLIQSYLALKGKCAQDPLHIITELMQCSACKWTTYCNADCQKKDWLKHKKICNSLPKNTDNLVNINYNINYRALIKKVIPTVKNLNFKSEPVEISSEELYLQKSLNSLSKMKSLDSTNLAIGVGGFCTLDLASVRDNIRYILIVDPSICTEFFWKKMVPIIQNAEDRKECEKKIHQNIIKCIEAYGHLDEKMGEHYISLLIKGTSWLSTEQRFSRIQKIFKDNHFAFIRMDLIDNVACRKIQSFHESHGLIADIMYISNVINFIHAEDLKKIGNSLSMLTTLETIFIDTEEEEYKITPNIAERFCYLSDCICFASNYEIKSLPKLKLRTKQRGDNIEKFYPIIELAGKIDPNKLFYAFGLFRDYYEQEEMETIDAIVQKIAPKNATEENIDLLTLKALYY